MYLLLKLYITKCFFKRHIFVYCHAAPSCKFFTLTSWFSWWRNVLKLCVPLTIDLKQKAKTIFWKEKDLSLSFARPKVAIYGYKNANCIYLAKSSFITIHNEITWLQLLERLIRALLCNLQKENIKEKEIFQIKIAFY